MLIKALLKEHKYRRTHKAGKPDENRGEIANMLSIEERPAEVADRAVPGHLEGDLILGKYKRSALGTLVERTTRFTILGSIRGSERCSQRERGLDRSIQNRSGRAEENIDL